MGTRGRLLLLCVFIVPAVGTGQRVLWQDTIVLITLQDRAAPGTSMIKYQVSQDFDYSLSCTNMLFSNWQNGGNTDFVSLFHHLQYRSQVIKGKNVKICNSFQHELGIQYFFDSISRFQPDENTLDTRVEVKIASNLTAFVFSHLTTRLFNSWHYSDDGNGRPAKTLYASFATPLIWTFSTGCGWVFPHLGTFNLGLSAGRFTWFRDKQIYRQANVVDLYGVRKNKNHIFEYGLSIYVLAEKDFLKRVHWDFDLIMFKNFKQPVDLMFKNQVGIRINKYLKGSVQTRLYYNKAVSRKFQVENMLSVGFYFQL
jgi:hypothetical protein